MAAGGRMSSPLEAPGAVEAREAASVARTYARIPLHPRSGRGARLRDAEGRVYWDLLAGIAVNALGHGHPRLRRTLREAADGVWHVSNLFFHPAQGRLAERLTAASGLSRAFFCNSGTEANEAALKFARLRHPGRDEVVALEESFHGRTLGALSVTGHARLPRAVRSAASRRPVRRSQRRRGARVGRVANAPPRSSSSR